ncbi:MAG: hypothetical protein GF347_00890 [Candidatus Moranbacteria bacterium]|nr:hypothetical protein [Candidatus Moranbacteria bacterium]
MKMKMKMKKTGFLLALVLIGTFVCVLSVEASLSKGNFYNATILGQISNREEPACAPEFDWGVGKNENNTFEPGSLNQSSPGLCINGSSVIDFEETSGGWSWNCE